MVTEACKVGDLDEGQAIFLFFENSGSFRFFETTFPNVVCSCNVCAKPPLNQGIILLEGHPDWWGQGLATYAVELLCYIREILVDCSICSFAGKQA